MGWKGRLGEAVLGLQSAGMRGRSTTGEGQHLRATAGTTAGDRGRGAASLFMSDVLGPGIWVLGSYGHVFSYLSSLPLSILHFFRRCGLGHSDISQRCTLQSLPLHSSQIELGLTYKKARSRTST
jgi:hypothetical protein